MFGSNWLLLELNNTQLKRNILKTVLKLDFFFVDKIENNLKIYNLGIFY